MHNCICVSVTVSLYLHPFDTAMFQNVPFNNVPRPWPMSMRGSLLGCELHARRSLWVQLMLCWDSLGQVCRGWRLGTLDAAHVPWILVPSFGGEMPWILLPNDRQIEVPRIQLPNGPAVKCDGPYYICSGTAYRCRETCYPIDWQIGAVYPPTQWAGGEVSWVLTPNCPNILWASRLVPCILIPNGPLTVYDMGCIRDGRLETMIYRQVDITPYGTFYHRYFWHSGFITLGCFITLTFCARTFYRCIFAVIVICLYVAYVQISLTIQMNHKSSMKTKLKHAIWQGLQGVSWRNL